MPSKRTEPRRFAEATKVTTQQSRAELERLLGQHGAREFSLYTSPERHIVQYRVNERVVRHVIDYPAPKNFQKYKLVKGAQKPHLTAEQLTKAADGEWRRRWRALLLLVKAKLELVASGQTTMDREFMGDVMLPDGRLVHEALEPLIKRAYLSGEVPAGLLLGSGT